MAGLPNILWIVTTQWRAQACGFAGDPNARTPHLDRLAAESIQFTQAVTPHPFGPFARAALFTGVPSPENGVSDYFDPLPTSAGTIAHDLNQKGYETAFFGKWHLSVRDREAPLVGEVHARTIVPPDRRGGFSFWEGFESGFQLNDPWLHGSRLAQPERFVGYQSDVLCERAVDYIIGGKVSAEGGEMPLIGGGRLGEPSLPRGATMTARPWFCAVSLESPHPPYDAPSGNVTARDASGIQLTVNVPRGGEAESNARRELAGYYAHIEATDRAIGRLITRVERREDHRGERNTIIVFTSVHGDMHGAHGLFRKGWPYEESIRVPLLIRPAGPQRTAQKSDDAISLIDLPRLTNRWAEGQRVEARGGVSSKISMPSVVALRNQCDRCWRGIRTADRKLILNEDGSPWLFYDLKNDPFEMTNLVSDPSWTAERAALADLT